MRVRSALGVVFLVGLTAPALADEPKAQPGSGATDREAVARLIKEGNALHDGGDFDAAIRKYREALALVPDNGEAMYEIAYSLLAKKDLKAAAEMAQAASHATKPPRSVPVLLGNIYDDMGESTLAIRSYRSGIAADPGFFLLYFNLGVAYGRNNRDNEARACLENSVALAPLHPGSHFELGRIYRKQGYRTATIMAVARALSLEPKSERAKSFISALDENFNAGVKTDAKGNSQITIDPNAPKDEGDFATTDVMIPILTLSVKTIPEAGGRLEGPPQAHQLISFLKSVGELGPKEFGKGFAAEYYGPFYTELVRSDAVNGFVAIVLGGVTSPEMSEWRAQNEANAKKAADIVARYRWKSPKVPPLPPDSVQADPSPTPKAR